MAASLSLPRAVQFPSGQETKEQELWFLRQTEHAPSRESTCGFGARRPESRNRVRGTALALRAGAMKKTTHDVLSEQDVLSGHWETRTLSGHWETRTPGRAGLSGRRRNRSGCAGHRLSGGARAGAAQTN